jgi:hypothetical protein
MGVIKYIGWTFAWLVAFVCATWATGALYFDFPTAGTFAVILFVIILLAAMVFVRGKLRKLAIVFRGDARGWQYLGASVPILDGRPAQQNIRGAWRPARANSLHSLQQFDTAYMRQLYEFGFEQAAAGYQWAKQPPRLAGEYEDDASP